MQLDFERGTIFTHIFGGTAERLRGGDFLGKKWIGCQITTS